MEVGALFNSAMLLFLVLGFGAAAGFFCERVGIINIAIDGQMIFGALIYSIFGALLNEALPDQGGMLFLIPTLIAMILSVLLTLLFGYIVINIKANHVVAGTGINLVVAGLGSFLTAPLGSAISGGVDQKLTSTFRGEIIIRDAVGDPVSNIFGETIIIFIIGFLILVGLSVFLYKSKFGLRFKAIGDNPNAVDAQGIDVNKYKWRAMMVSGILAAFAGSLFMYGGPLMYQQSPFFEGNVSGLGFLALAIVIAGIWRLPFILTAALAFALIIGVFNRVVNLDEIGVNAIKITQMIPFALSLIALAAFSWMGSPPMSLGKSFDKSER